jgi:hypothetical protein
MYMGTSYPSHWLNTTYNISITWLQCRVRAVQSRAFSITWLYEKKEVPAKMRTQINV